MKSLQLDILIQKKNINPLSKNIYSARPDKHGRLVWYLVKSDTNVHYCTVAYTGQVTFYKVPEQQGHA